MIGTLLGAVVLTAALVATPGPVGSTAGAVPVPARLPLPAGTRISIEGGDAFSRFELADRLQESGAELHGVEPASSTTTLESETTILYYDRSQREAASQVRAMLGRGTMRRETAFQPGVDVMIVLGKDRSDS